MHQSTMKPTVDASSGLTARVLVGGIRAYQVARSGRVSPCRFTPTCSQFAVEAVTRHGARRGTAMTLRRLMRCRPGGPGGFDPVPDQLRSE
jgi:putative membrane protein insertion efficiency factor